MISTLALILSTAITSQSNSFDFQAAVIPHQDMNKAVIAADFMHYASYGDSSAHVLVRFDSPPSQNTKDELKAHGVEIQKSLGGSSYIASLKPRTLDPRGVMMVSNIKEVRQFEPTWKLHAYLADGFIPNWTMPTSGMHVDDPIIAVYVMLHSDIDLQETAREYERFYGAFVRSTIEAIDTIVMEIPYSTIDLLIEEDRVLYLEPALPKFTESNNSNRAVTQADTAQDAPYNLDGEGVVVMVYDGGYGLSSHSDFSGRHTVRDSSGLSDHATHVAGTIGGDGSGNALYTGMAPAVTIESYGFEQEGGLSQGFLYTDPGDLAEDYGQAINSYGAVLANNSIGTNTAPNGFPCDWTGNYGITSNLIDSVVRGDLGGDIRIIWANGNERGSSNCGTSYVSTAPPACAKNHITVGAINSNDESMTYFSSWGPTDDGRIKPDISAPGCQSNDDNGVTSCSSSGSYNSKCGTSMACPTVTGLSALIMQDWRAQFPGEADMRSATLKSLLAHTAEDKFNEGPDCQYGYGSVRVVDAIDHVREENFAELEVSQGETVEMLVYVEQSSEVKVTIAWDDVPATPLVIPSLVNDIDLIVIDPNGTTHYPWTIDPSNPGAPAVRTSPDHLNNIEQVEIDAGLTGVYRIQITGYNIAEGPQEFSLMASPLLIQCSSSGMVSLDRSAYACGATVAVQLVDCDLNTDDNVVESTQVIVSSTSGDETFLTLTETGAATASFMGSLVLDVDLDASEGDEITVTYEDGDNGQGGNDVVTDAAVVDCTPPTIENVSIIDVLTREATVLVTTDEWTTVTVMFGTSCTELDESSTSNALNDSHEVVLSGLDDNTTYFFAVNAYDASGNAVMDDNGGNCYTFTTADVPDFFTELFSGSFDMDGFSLTFTPYGNVDQYRACAEPISQLPSDPNGGTNISLGDDDSEQVSTSPAVILYGESYDSLYICSNGRITFGSGSNDYTETIGEHFAMPAIAMLWDDLNPSNGGTVLYAQLPDRAVVTFNNVPEYSNSGSNTFQCEMFYDGMIRVSWLGVDSGDNVVGLSAGNSTPEGFEQSDLSELAECGEPDVPGDVNGDGLANVTDLLAIMDAWGPCDNCDADLNDDGQVNVSDLLEVIGNWSI